METHLYIGTGSTSALNLSNQIPINLACISKSGTNLLTSLNVPDAIIFPYTITQREPELSVTDCEEATVTGPADIAEKPAAIV